MRTGCPGSGIVPDPYDANHLGGHPHDQVTARAGAAASASAAVSVVDRANESVVRDLGRAVRHAELVMIDDGACEDDAEPLSSGYTSGVTPFLGPGRPKAAVIVLNGGSSSGKSSIARRLQDRLGPTWLTLGVDDLIRALPGGGEPVGAGASIDFGADGSVTVNDDFRRAEVAWYEGLAAMARTGTGVIIDEVLMGGKSSQARLAATLSGLSVTWVGVRCDPDVAAARELTRPDRVVGMARFQAERVHDGVQYDLVVDTTGNTAADCATFVAAFVLRHDS